MSAAERVDQVIELDDRVAVELAGEQDRVLRDLEDRLDVEIALRGNRLTLTGMEPRVRAGAEVVGQLAEMVHERAPDRPGHHRERRRRRRGVRGDRARSSTTWCGATAASS